MENNVGYQELSDEQLGMVVGGEDIDVGGELLALRHLGLRLVKLTSDFGNNTVVLPVGNAIFRDFQRRNGLDDGSGGNVGIAR